MGKLVSLHRVKDPSLLANQRRAEKPRRPTPDKPLIISASELGTFQRCRVKWWWRYICNFEPADKPEGLAFGEVGHDVMEAFYTYPWRKRDVKSMRRCTSQHVAATQYKVMDTERKELLVSMCLGYADWQLEENEAIGLRECVPERKFELPLVPDRSIMVHGRLDTIFKPVNLKKTIASVERKFKKQIQMDIVEVNLQLSVYLWALSVLYPGNKEYQIHYRVLRKQMPGPRVTAPLFGSEPVTRTPGQIRAWVEDTRNTALEMIDAAVYPNPMDACSWDCDFKMPCLLRGEDDDLVSALQNTDLYQINKRDK